MRIRVGIRETRQVVYVSGNTSGFYLSESALKDLELIPRNFPSQTSRIDAPAIVNGKALCGCPRRITVPNKLANIPFPPIASNRGRLELWLREHFKSSALNTSPHQPWQIMTGRPLDITFTQGEKPSAVHTPIPVSHHWKKRMKQDLDRDVALGIIEPVPTGTPTVWCSRMVVAPKKDGSPGRTVDLQKLNAGTRRETHHTPSPFNQVSVVPARIKKNCPRCMKWVPQLATFPSCNHIHNRMGPLSVPQSILRFSRVWGRIHSPIRRCYGGYNPKISLHWRLSSLGRNHWVCFFAHSWIHYPLWQKWNCLQPR